MDPLLILMGQINELIRANPGDQGVRLPGDGLGAVDEVVIHLPCPLGDDTGGQPPEHVSQSDENLSTRDIHMSCIWSAECPDCTNDDF